jgi:hypothetical protein
MADSTVSTQSMANDPLSWSVCQHLTLAYLNPELHILIAVAPRQHREKHEFKHGKQALLRQKPLYLDATKESMVWRGKQAVPMQGPLHLNGAKVSMVRHGMQALLTEQPNR